MCQRGQQLCRSFRRKLHSTTYIPSSSGRRGVRTAGDWRPDELGEAARACDCGSSGDMVRELGHQGGKSAGLMRPDLVRRIARMSSGGRAGRRARAPKAHASTAAAVLGARTSRPQGCSPPPSSRPNPSRQHQEASVLCDRHFRSASGRCTFSQV